MYVCICNRVTDRQILDAAKQGATTLEALGDRLNVATCCGRCAECACELLSDHANRSTTAQTLKVA